MTDRWTIRYATKDAADIMFDGEHWGSLLPKKAIEVVWKLNQRERWLLEGADMERELSDLRKQLAARQEPLGPEFEQVLFNNSWDLYAR